MTFWSNVLIPVTSMMITVFATLYTVSQRVKNENREKHKPYLTLNNIEQQEKLDEYKYYLTLTGRNYIEKQNIEKEKTQENKYISVTLLLDNIGYGVASNIKFYNLLTGKEIRGTQTPSKDKNQKLFTTFDIASNQEKKVQAKIINTKKATDEIEITDHCRMLCVYQDLNGNIYNLIISINIKSNDSYDFFTYQRTSHSYQKWIKENKTQYKKIMRQYKK